MFLSHCQILPQCKVLSPKSINSFTFLTLIIQTVSSSTTNKFVICYFRSVSTYMDVAVWSTPALYCFKWCSNGVCKSVSHIKDVLHFCACCSTHCVCIYKYVCDQKYLQKWFIKYYFLRSVNISEKRYQIKKLLKYLLRYSALNPTDISSLVSMI